MKFTVEGNKEFVQLYIYLIRISFILYCIVIKILNCKITLLITLVINRAAEDV